VLESVIFVIGCEFKQKAFLIKMKVELTKNGRQSWDL